MRDLQSHQSQDTDQSPMQSEKFEHTDSRKEVLTATAAEKLHEVADKSTSISEESGRNMIPSERLLHLDLPREILISNMSSNNHQPHVASSERVPKLPQRIFSFFRGCKLV